LIIGDHIAKSRSSKMKRHPRPLVWAALVSAVIFFAVGSSAAQPIKSGVSILPSQTTSDVPPTTPAFVDKPHLLGDWGGVRTYLGNLGIYIGLDYTTETAWNVSGGIRRGVDYADQKGVEVDIDWEKLAGITGFSTHTVLINRAGRNTSADYIGDNVIQAQEIYGAAFDMAVRLVHFYGEQKLWDGRVDLAAGRLAVGDDFAGSVFYCDFMTLTSCGHSRALTSNAGFSNWPTASWGGRVRVKPTADIYVQLGLYEATPFPQGGRAGWDWSTTHATGEVFPLEVAYEPMIGAARMPGHYKAGVIYDNSTYPDIYQDYRGQPLVQSGLTARNRHGRSSFYVTADQMVVRQGPGDDNGVILLAAYVHNSPDTSMFEHFAWIALLDTGFWAARPLDRIGLSGTYYKLSPRLTATEGLQQDLGLPFTGGAYGVQSDALVLEANYNFPIYCGVELQPEIEYFIRPGGQSNIRNAFELGLKTHVQF